ncbi:MAG: hypothetical protein JHC41_02210 [Nitrosopumilus sp.]|jgi:hypothetical protein|nr:hypothetical protein [Nitrosopumilus sp.]
MFLKQNEQKINKANFHTCKLCNVASLPKFHTCPNCNFSIQKREVRTNDNDSLIELAIEKALLEMGYPELNLVKSRLKDDYDCGISDCLEHPEYLKIILCDLFGNSHYDIMESINKTLKITSMDKPITDFLSVITVNA